MGFAKIFLTGVAILAASAAPAADPGEWELIAERDGIVVSRQLVPGRNFPRLRATAEIDATPHELLAVLLDVPAYVHWVPDCSEARVVRRIGTWRRLVYMRTDLPSPVADRDIVAMHDVQFGRTPARVRLEFRAAASDRQPPVAGIVRMSRASGHYAIESIDGGRSRVLYEVDADPAGELPDWLIAAQSTRNPLETLAGLRQRAAETRGRYRELIATFPGGNAPL